MAFLELGSEKLCLKFRHRKQIPCFSITHTLAAERRVGQVVEKMNHKYQKHRFRFKKKKKKSEGDTLAN